MFTLLFFCLLFLQLVEIQSLFLKLYKIEEIPYLENHYQKETHLQQKLSITKESITKYMTTSSPQFGNDIFAFDSDEEQQVQDNLQDLVHKSENPIKYTNNGFTSQKHSQLETYQNNIFIFQEDEKVLNYMEKRTVTPIGTNTRIVDIKPKTKNTDVLLNTKSSGINNKQSLNSKPYLCQNYNFKQFLEKQNTLLPHPSANSIQGARILASDSNHQTQYQYVEEQKAIKVTNLKQFLFTQLSPQYKVNILIRKADEGFFNKIVNKTKYYVTIQENGKFLFSVTKEGFNKLIFSMSKDNPTSKNKNYLGQLLGRDFSNTQFLLFDDGFDPEETKSLQFSYKQLAWVKYEQTSGPRKFTVIISTNNKGFHCIEKEVNIIEKKWSQKKDRHSLCRLQNKEPVLDELDGNLKLDFKGMVGKASIKNFILSSVEFVDSLIFVRRSEDTYGVEVRHPFSLMQAVGICMSSIYHKVVL